MAITPNNLQAKSAGGFGTVAHGIITLLRQWYSSGITVLAGFTGTTLTLNGTAPATPTANVLYKDNIPKAWVNFNGTGTVAIRDDFNVSSITDAGVGLYTINFATAFADTNYIQTGTVAYTGAVTPSIFTVSMPDGGGTKTVNAMQIETAYVNSTVNRTNFDFEEVYCVFYGRQ